MSDPSLIALPQRLPTGIAGLDQILGGGLFKGGVYMLAGMPGLGKTILANQWCFAQVANGGRAVYITLLAEQHARLFAQLQPFSFFDSTMLGSKIQYFSGSAQLSADGVAGLFSFLQTTIRTQRPTVLVLDGMSSLDEDMTLTRTFIHFLLQLQVMAQATNCTLLLLTSHPTVNPYHPIATLVDGVIELTKHRIGPRVIRQIEVLKFRGAGFIEGLHFYQITSNGIEIYPRFEQQEFRLIPERSLSAPPVGFGINLLDQMLGGGLVEGTTTLLYGVSGSGKTVLALQFLATGAQQGERGLYFGFHEPICDIFIKAESIGAVLQSYTESGLINVHWENPSEAMTDLIVQRLLHLVDTYQIQRLVIDGLSELQDGIIYPERLPSFYSTFLNTLRVRGVTTIITYETARLVGPEVDVGPRELSPFVDTLIFLRYVEFQSQLYRLLSIVKMRQSLHDTAIREFQITVNGIDVALNIQSAEVILGGVSHPLRSAGSSKPDPDHSSES